MNIEKLLNKTNVVKTIDFNRPEWKGIIDVKCELYDGAGLGFTISIIRHDKPPLDICTLGVTKKMLQTQIEWLGYAVQEILPVYDKLHKELDAQRDETRGRYLKAIEEAINAFEEFLKENYRKEKFSCKV